MFVSHEQLDAPDGIEEVIRAAASGEGYSIQDLSVVLTDHETVRRLNESHLDRSYVTDVLAFDLSDALTARSQMLDGEIYVDLDTAVERAPEFETTYDQEVRRYIVHGLLHLMGYRDDGPDGKHEMRRLENLYLGVFSTQ